MFKKIICIFISLVLMISFTGCAKNASEINPSISAEITSKAIDEFLSITKVPRPSYHLDKIFDYLINYAKEHSFKYASDAYGNFWMDIPASSGYENVPKVILQAHMDMVCVAEKDYNIDFENTGITAVVEGNTITADRTSLGADNGIGIAIIMAIITSDAPHGPIRALITADEDVGLLGAAELPAEALDSDYLINIDDEEANEIVCSSAGNITQVSSKTCNVGEASNDFETISISISGLLGGHSGADIDKNRLSAVVVFRDLLNTVKNEKIVFEIGSINGGAAQNAIATSVDATIAIPAKDLPKFKGISEKLISDYRSDYPNEKLTIDISTIDASKVLFISREDSLNFLELLSSFPQGVLAMSQKNEGLVQTSSNIGIISVNDGECQICTSTRSCVTSDLDDLKAEMEALVKEKGYSFNINVYYPGWDGDPNTPLMNLVKEGYEKSTGKEVSIIPIHAGLECSWFVQKREGIQIACIGPRIENPHSTNEVLYIDTIEPCVKTILYALENMSAVCR